MKVSQTIIDQIESLEPMELLGRKLVYSSRWGIYVYDGTEPSATPEEEA